MIGGIAVVGPRRLRLDQVERTGTGSPVFVSSCAKMDTLTPMPTYVLWLWVLAWASYAWPMEIYW